jgi:hypothetical protein
MESVRSIPCWRGCAVWPKDNQHAPEYFCFLSPLRRYRQLGTVPAVDLAQAARRRDLVRMADRLAVHLSRATTGQELLSRPGLRSASRPNPLDRNHLLTDATPSVSMR